MPFSNLSRGELVPLYALAQDSERIRPTVADNTQFHVPPCRSRAVKIGYAARLISGTRGVLGRSAPM